MALANFGTFVPLLKIPDGMVGAPTSRNLSASTHWVGEQFYAADTSISAVHFLTGTVSSPVFDVEIAVVNLDSSGYPLGSDIAVSSAQGSLAANTNYGLSITASGLTVGSLYGIILRIKSGTYTSGSANILINQTYIWYGINGGNQLGNAYSSYNIGSNTKSIAYGCLQPKYGSGWLPTLGVSATGTRSALTVAANSGDVGGMKFTIANRLTVYGYLAYTNNGSSNVNCEMYAGTDNTAITGSSVALPANGVRNSTSNQGTTYVMLPAPVTLEPGTYRVGCRNTSAASNSVQQMTGLVEAGAGAVENALLGSAMKTVYTSGAWTDTNTALVAVTPLVASVEDGRPRPQFAIGGIA